MGQPNTLGVILEEFLQTGTKDAMCVAMPMNSWSSFVFCGICNAVIAATRPSDRDQIWHAREEISGNGSNLKKLPLPQVGF